MTLDLIKLDTPIVANDISLTPVCLRLNCGIVGISIPELQTHYCEQAT